MYVKAAIPAHTWMKVSFFITDMLLLILEYYWSMIEVQETTHIDIEFYEC